MTQPNTSQWNSVPYRDTEEPAKRSGHHCDSGGTSRGDGISPCCDGREGREKVIIALTSVFTKIELSVFIRIMCTNVYIHASCTLHMQQKAMPFVHWDLPPNITVQAVNTQFESYYLPYKEDENLPLSDFCGGREVPSHLAMVIR